MPNACGTPRNIILGCAYFVDFPRFRSMFSFFDNNQAKHVGQRCTVVVRRIQVQLGICGCWPLLADLICIDLDWIIIGHIGLILRLYKRRPFRLKRHFCFFYSVLNFVVVVSIICVGCRSWNVLCRWSAFMHQF